MQLNIMKNIIDSVRARVRPVMLEELYTDKIFTKKALTVVSSVIYIPLILAAIFLSRDAIFSLGGLLVLVLWGGLGSASLISGFRHLKDINKNINIVNSGNFEYIRHICNDLARVKQKLHPEEVQQLLKLSFIEDDFKTLSYEIKEKGYLTHDDVYRIYDRLERESRRFNIQKEEVERKNNNLQNFLIENSVIEQVVEKSDATTPLVSVLKDEYQQLHIKHFNSKSTL